MKRIINFSTQSLKSHAKAMKFPNFIFTRIPLYTFCTNNPNNINNINNGKVDKEKEKEKDNSNGKSEIKIIKIPYNEDMTIEEFTQSSGHNTYSKEEQKEKEKIENFPLIHYTQPILPYAKIFLNNPSKNDILFNMLIKYGKLTPID